MLWSLSSEVFAVIVWGVFGPMEHPCGSSIGDARLCFRMNNSPMPISWVLAAAETASPQLVTIVMYERRIRNCYGTLRILSMQLKRVSGICRMAGLKVRTMFSTANWMQS